MLPKLLTSLAFVALALYSSVASADARDGELDPLNLNVALMDEILRESTEETIRVQRIAAITGITIGTALLGLGTNVSRRGGGLSFGATF